ncbi:MAG: hypothetical protein LBR36_09485 [Bacteroidales bacterium]|jgi:hypothetical protein|nr:hypothetical protein [Bacteroidales bacterium]
MKKLALVVIGLATIMVAVDGCKKQEEETGNGKNIRISLPYEDTVLVLDLGDSAKAMQGVVIKNGQGKQITEGIVIEGLDEVGRKMLIYKVEESDGKIVQTKREAIVRVNKLLGKYVRTYPLRPNYTPDTIEFVKNDTNLCALTCAPYIWLGTQYDSAVFVADKSIPYSLKFISYAKEYPSSIYGKAHMVYSKKENVFSIDAIYVEFYVKNVDTLQMRDTFLMTEKLL